MASKEGQCDFTQSSLHAETRQKPARLSASQLVQAIPFIVCTQVVRLCEQLGSMFYVVYAYTPTPITVYYSMRDVAVCLYYTNIHLCACFEIQIDSVGCCC